MDSNSNAISLILYVSHLSSPFLDTWGPEMEHEDATRSSTSICSIGRPLMKPYQDIYMYSVHILTYLHLDSSCICAILDHRSHIIRVHLLDLVFNNENKSIIYNYLIIVFYYISPNYKGIINHMPK